VIVVAAAIVRQGHVLAAHRRTPVGWEFPGGKVEAGETEHEALRRECREELGIGIEVGAQLGRQAIDQRLELRLYAARLVDGEPVIGADHDQVRWLSASELLTLGWLPADRALLSVLPLWPQWG
jgi:8-oxo-dGTP diphosphatase